MRGDQIRPIDDLQPAIMMFDECSQTLHPVAIIAVKKTVNFTNFCLMNMSTNNAITTPQTGFSCHDVFKIRNIANSVFYLML